MVTVNRSSYGSLANSLFCYRRFLRRPRRRRYQTTTKLLIGILGFVALRYLFDLYSVLTWNKNIPAYVITLANKDERVPRVQELFRKYANLHLKPFYGIDGQTLKGKYRRRLNRGQRGLRETMRLLIATTIERNHEQVFVFQDDAIPHLNFTYLFQNLLQKCRDADVLLLGSSQWYPKRKHWEREACFDADRRTFGAYGLLIKKTAFQPILDVMNNRKHITFDHIYPHLRQINITVRVAYPKFLVIMDVTHKSSINNRRTNIQFNASARANIHHWNLSEYPIAHY